jgi:Tfp pilus assembly protein PilF
LFITKASDSIELSPQFENAFIQSNPESYYMYQILGNYYASRKNNAKAIEYYNSALTKEIATLKEERQIKDSRDKCKN